MATHTIPTIKAQKRSRLGSRYAARERKQGLLPTVIYGHQQDPLHVSVDREELTHILQQRAHLLEVVVDGQTEPCLVKDVQWDHLGIRLIHLDLARVDLTEQVTVSVDLVFVGEPKGAKEAGAVLEKPLNTLEIQCLATQIPEMIQVDVSNLGVDEAIMVSNLVLPEGVKTVEDPETVVAAVRVVAEEIAPVVAVEGETAEPEVIGRPAKEEAEAEGKPEKK